MVCCISISLDRNQSTIKDSNYPLLHPRFDTLSIVSTWASKGSGRDNLSVWGWVFEEFQLICRSHSRVISLFTLLINTGFFIILHCQQFLSIQIRRWRRKCRFNLNRKLTLYPLSVSTQNLLKDQAIFKLVFMPSMWSQFSYWPYKVDFHAGHEKPIFMPGMKSDSTCPA